MYHNLTMEATFEAEKNRRAFIYTIIICALLLILAVLITWPIMEVKPPLAQDLIEINLGNDKEGFGEKQPLIKGHMGPSQEAVQQRQQVAAAAPKTPEKTVQPDENAEKDAAPVTKPEKPVRQSNSITDHPVHKPVKTTYPAQVVLPAPKPQKPKFTYNGAGKGTGNDATEDNGYRYQGNKPGGKGDAGSPGGKPDSYGNSPGGRSGVSVTKGVRPLNFGELRFEDDFTENAKVYMDVRYDGSGRFISAGLVKGTTTSNSTILGIARRKAAQLKFPPNTTDGGITTVLFNFRVQN